MAGTPTTNYNIPTYADTDAPDLSGAYNDAMDIIDTQLKANADAIESASTGNYTGTNPITVDNEGRTISVATATPGEDGTTSAYGATRVSGKASDIGTGNALNGTTVPNCKAVADYVAAHGGTAYTAGEGISISDGKVSQVRAGSATTTSGNLVIGQLGGVHFAGNGATITACINATQTGSDTYNAEAVVTVPNCYGLKDYVDSRMAAAGAAYTGTAPVVVDNGSHTISVTRNQQISADNIDAFIAATPSVRNANLTPVFTISADTAYRKILDNNDEEHNWVAGWTAPTCAVVDGAIRRATPNASTTVKGLVQLTTAVIHGDNALALTGSAITNAKNAATTHVTVQDLANNLYYDPNSQMVFYKPSN